MKKLVDFIVIGAARSGTTSLFTYLRAHPEIFIPAEKEISFFSDNDKYALGETWYIGNYYSKVDKRKITGDVTPAYMFFDYVPERIHRSTPGSKLVAILRNPVERAYSHFLFARRLGIENRDFQTAIKSLLTRGRVSDEQVVSQNLEYLRFGEYGRIFKRYLRYFPREQLMLVFFEDLEYHPYSTMERMYEFLGVDKNFKSEIFNRRENASGVARIASLQRVQNALSRSKKMKAVITRIIPPNIVGAIDTWLTLKANMVPRKDPGPDRETVRAMEEYFREEIRTFESICGLKVPWPAFAGDI